MRAFAVIITFALAMLAAGCAVSVPSVTGSDTSGDLGSSQGIATAPWLALDLVTGSYRALADPGDTSLEQWRDTHLLFRRVEASSGPAYLAVFATTQAQWQRLGGARPWDEIDAEVVAAAGIGGNRPAYGLSYEAITAVLGTWNAERDFRLSVPSEAEWLAATETASAGTWTWGNDSSRATVRDHALVHETRVPPQPAAPRAVGTLDANARGFHDLAGNVWEWCHPGTALRGGSWRDGLWAARSANRLTTDDAGIDPGADHALFGLRLALRP